MVAAYPLIIVLILAVVGVDLLAEFAVEVVVVVLIAIFAEESVLVLLHPRPDLLVDLLGTAQLVEALPAGGQLLLSLLIALAALFLLLALGTLGDVGFLVLFVGFALSFVSGLQ